MDKQEYKLRAEQIKSLIAKRDFFEAAKIADEIDWTRVRSVAMLCTVSDLYKANRRYKESKELLLMAYERHPNGRMILYSLCELCIKMGEVVQAIEYYKEFVQLAPMDNGKYILQYKLYVAQDVSLEERIAVLEELKKRDYREKWGYELAYLYHRIGLATKCVEECDELILWFSDGRYVKKAMELKMLHQPLTPAQEASYHSFIGKDATLPRPNSVEENKGEMDIEVPPMNVGQYDTINLQKALAESMEEVLKPTEVVASKEVEEEQETEGMGSVTSQIMAPMFQNTENIKEIYFEDQTGEVAVPVEAVENPIDLKQQAIHQEEIVIEEDSAPVKEIVIEEESVPEKEIAIEETPFVKEEAEEEPLPVKKTDVLGDMKEILPQEAVPAMSDNVVVTTTKEEEEEAKPESQTGVSLAGVPYEVPGDATKKIPSIREIMKRPLIENVQKQEETETNKPVYTADGIPRTMANLLSQEYDGQISLVVPKEAKVEKQITGQMNIEDVLEEWEKTKKEYEEKRKAQLTQKVLEQTGNMFTEFEAKARDGILEQLQKEATIDELPEVEELEEIQEEVPEIMESEEQPLEETNGTREETTEETFEEIEEVEETSQVTDEVMDEEESVAEATPDEVERTIQKIQQAHEDIRELTEEEKALFAPFIQTKGARRRFMKALDMISLAAYTGNVIVTGEADSETVKLAKNIMKNIQMTDANFSGVIAKVSGASLNSKSVESTIAKLNNGGLIIEKASGMNSQAVMKLLKALNQEKTGIVVILEDNKKAIKRMLAAYPSMATFFNARIEIEELNNAALAAYGKQYAAHQEYSIDELGILALQTRIEERQTSEHIVTVSEVREIVDEAIENVNRKTIGHFFDVVLGKRYDDEDMIVLREKDFM